jgi:hypothetical protein
MPALLREPRKELEATVRQARVAETETSKAIKELEAAVD